jgi:hypothetical protein
MVMGCKKATHLKNLVRGISINYRELFVRSMQLQNSGNFGDRFRVGKRAVSRRDYQFGFREVQVRACIGDDSIGTIRLITVTPISDDGVNWDAGQIALESLKKLRVRRKTMNARGELSAINREALELRNDPGRQIDQTHAECGQVPHRHCATLMGSGYEDDPSDIPPWFKNDGIPG